jgi:hypothetical protein
VSDAAGVLTWAVPAGYAWCLHEIVAPAGYQVDPAFHCTDVITTDTSAAVATIALPEFPLAPTLAFTGTPLLPTVGGGLCLVLGGLSVRALGRRSPRRSADHAVSRFRRRPRHSAGRFPRSP